MVFNRLKAAITSAASALKAGVGEKVAYRTISESDIEDALEEFLINLVEADVAYEVAEEIVEEVRRSLVGSKVRRGEDVEKIVVEAVRRKVLEKLGRPGPDIVELAREKCKTGQPLVVLFLGVNGVGKTTTIAKIAAMLKEAGMTPVLAAADTFRAGAQEQLETHAERLGVPVVKGDYGRDPASVAVDAINHAKARGYCVVLVDTAGRMHVDYDLMGELRKIVRVAGPDLKVLVVDSLTGNDAVEQARRFNEEVGVDGVILTKMDADVKGGTAISVAAATGRPILYVGVGQGYRDLERFDPERFASSILG